jgi:hypothetical protein
MSLKDQKKDKVTEIFYTRLYKKRKEIVTQKKETTVSGDGRLCTITYRHGNNTKYSYPFYSKKVYYINENTQIDNIFCLMST